MTRRNKQGQKGHDWKRTPLLLSQDDVALLATKMEDIKLVFTKMASAMTQLVEDQAADKGSTHHDHSLLEESSGNEVVPSPHGGGKCRASSHLLRTRDKTQDSSHQYYAVAQGRSPGIYTDWGDAKQQVNCFLGALYKKFKTCKEAQHFMD